MNQRVTDEQARTFAAYDREDSGATVWYRVDPALLEREDQDESPYDAGEFDWMRDLALDLLGERARVAGLILALEDIRALPIAHGVMRQIIADALRVATEGMAAPRTARPEPACECNGDGECGYCAEQAVCRAEALGESLRDERAVRS